MVKNDKEALLTFFAAVNKILEGGGRVIIRRMDDWPIYSECEKELELVNGVMDLVGEDKILGHAFELKVEVWK